MHKIKTSVFFLALLTAWGANGADDEIPSDGDITIFGSLTSETCTIDANGIHKTVNLPVISASLLKKTGDEAGSTRFTISVFNCSPGVQEIGIHFDVNGTTFDPETGNLVNTAKLEDNPASNVQIRLYDMKNGAVAPIPIGTNGSKFKLVPNEEKPDEGSGAVMKYAAGYYATGTTTAGSVYAQAYYTLDYN